MTNNTPDYEDNLYFEEKKMSETVTIEKQVWESTLNRSMELQAENDKLKEQINHLSKTQARQFRDNQNLQVKAEKAKDVVNIDMARQIKQLKELLKECSPYVSRSATSRMIKNSIGFKKDMKLLTKIDEAIK